MYTCSVSSKAEVGQATLVTPHFAHAPASSLDYSTALAVFPSTTTSLAFARHRNAAAPFTRVPFGMKI